MLDLPIPFKAGDSFLLTCDLVVDGVRKDIALAEITCQVRTTSGALAWDCAVVKFPEEDGSGTFVYTVSAAPAATAGAPLGRLETDIRYTWPDGTVDTTPTVAIDCGRQVSRGA